MSEKAQELVKRNYRSTVGFWIYLMSDSILFASLFAAYLVLQSGVANGPDAKEVFTLPLVLAETLILLTSSLTCGLALLSLRYKKIKQAVVFMAITYAMGVAFLTIELTEFSALIGDGNSWTQSAFLSGFFALVGTHGIHILVGLIWLLVLVCVLARKGVTEKLTRQFALFGLFWHFLDLVWIFIFSVVYLGGVIQ